MLLNVVTDNNGSLQVMLIDFGDVFGETVRQLLNDLP